jgi:hypothetical protein
MNHRSLTLLVLAALLPGAGLAQSETETKVILRYDVEVVIFRNLQVPKSREFILPISSPNKDEKILELSSASSVTAAGKLNYELVPGDSYRLVEVVTKLVESPRYELLIHTAWRQPGLDLEQVLPVWIKGGRIYGNEYTSIDSQIEFFENLPKNDSPDLADGKSYEFDEQSLEALELQLLEQQGGQQHQGLYELEGKITIALSRYLHAYTDLVLRRPRLSVDSVLRNPAQDRYLAAHTADTRILNNHSMKEHRRMRSKNLHYIDNPEFAMLILITPYKTPE